MIKPVKEIDEVVKKMKVRLQAFETDVGASEEEISALEHEFGVVFPEDYKYFLHKYGYACWDGSDILGVCSNPELESYFSMPYYTRDDRASILPKHFSSRPDNCVIVGAYGGGGHFYLYCQNSESPGKVALLLDELHGKASNQSWSTFTKFLAHY